MINVAPSAVMKSSVDLRAFAAVSDDIVAVGAVTVCNVCCSFR